MNKKNKSKVVSALVVSLGVLSGSVLATTLPAQKSEQAGLAEAIQEEQGAFNNGQNSQAENNQGIVVKAVREGQNKLTGLKQLQGAEEAQILKQMYDGDDCDDDDDDDCEELDGVEQYKTIEEAGKKAAGKVKKFLKKEQNEAAPTYAQDNPKAAYKAYGVSYNADKKAWEWNGKVIRFLWDANKHWHVNSSVEAVTNGVKVKVVRDAKGNITKLVEMSDKEYNKLKKSNDFLAKAL